MPVIGVDIGGTSIRAGLFSASGRAEASVRVPLRQWGWPLPLEPLATFLLQQIQEWEPQYGSVQAVGLAAAAVVEPRTGFVHVGENLGWSDLPVGATLETRLRRPVRVDVDAFCGALAEGAVGSGAGLANFLYVVIGTGIGHGLMLHGRLHHGAHGAANVFGHLKVVPGGEPCYCGGAGCLCQYASGSALLRQARLASGQQELSAQAIAHAYATGAAWAVQSVDAWLDWMALALANALNLLDLETVILGGGVIRPAFPDLGRLHARVQALTYPEIRPIRLCRAALGDESVLVGAAELAFNAMQGSG